MADQERSIMPEIKILRSPVDIVCGCLGRFAMLPSSSEPCLSEHHVEPIVEPLEVQEDLGF